MSDLPAPDYADVSFPMIAPIKGAAALLGWTRIRVDWRLPVPPPFYRIEWPPRAPEPPASASIAAATPRAFQCAALRRLPIHRLGYRANSLGSSCLWAYVHPDVTDDEALDVMREAYHVQ